MRWWRRIIRNISGRGLSSCQLLEKMKIKLVELSEQVLHKHRQTKPWFGEAFELVLAGAYDRVSPEEGQQSLSAYRAMSGLA